MNLASHLTCDTLGNCIQGSHEITWVVPLIIGLFVGVTIMFLNR